MGAAEEKTDNEKEGGAELKAAVETEGTASAVEGEHEISTKGKGANDGDGGENSKDVSGDNNTKSTPKTPAAGENKKRQSMTPTGPPAMDSHPYPRGSVIEVLYIPATAVGQTLSSIQASNSAEDPWYWSEDSSLCSTTSGSSNEKEEDEEEDDEAGRGGGKQKQDISRSNSDADMKDSEDDNQESDNKEKDEKDEPSPSKTVSSEKDEKEANNSSSPRDGRKHHHHHHHHHKNAASVRLADVIDRVPLSNVTTPTGQQAWRYYVHYRDFNRRMDEWVAMDRVVSPPSVGNAKARALKKEEEKMKRKQQKAEEKQRAEKEQKTMADIDVTAPRASRRRGSVLQQPPNVNASLNSSNHSQQGGPTTSSSGAAGAAASSAAAPGGDAAAVRSDGEGRGGEGPGGVRRRATRRKSTNAMEDDAATVVASNQVEEPKNDKSPADIKEVLTLNATAADAMETTTVGEHVVATIPAQELDEHEGLDEASLREHEEITKIKNVSFIELGRHQMETWYFSPIPKELLSQKGYIEVLYICEFTFRMFARKVELQRYQRRSLKPQDRHPPGNEIYRKGNLSTPRSSSPVFVLASAVFEVDGQSEKIYCQNLCYIAKLFLDHKTLFFDVDVFLFYVLCEVDDRGYHPVGYYSKEKYSDVGYNLACILTFPAHQRKGYGRFLIAFSYELSKKQEKVGGPERPVSDLGQKAYKPYWAATVIDFLRQIGGGNKDREGNISASSLSIMDISKMTSIMAEDIVFTLNQLGILKIINGVYFVAAAEELLDNLAKKYPVKEPRVDPSKLHWTPFLTDVKRDKFSIHSKKPTVESYNMVVQQVSAAPAKQQGQTPSQQKQ